jgi:hypothetical protein
VRAGGRAKNGHSQEDAYLPIFKDEQIKEDSGSTIQIASNVYPGVDHVYGR